MILDSRPNYAPWNISPFSGGSAEDFLRHLIGWAILAPNAHNAQKWKFILHPEVLTINAYVPEHTVSPISDPLGRQAYISLGCAIENLILAAENYGYAAKIIRQSHCYAISLHSYMRGGQNIKRQEILFTVIRNRAMNRGLYDQARPIPMALKQSFKDAARDFGVKVFFIENFFGRFAIAKMQHFADRYILKQQDFCHELATYMLPDNSLSPIGMPGNTLGFSEDSAKEIRKLLSQGEHLPAHLAAQFTLPGYAGMLSAPLIVIISTLKDTPDFWIKAGRTLQRMALEAESAGLSISIHAAMSEAAPLNFILKLGLRTSYRPAVIFRVGYAMSKSPHSPRLTSNEVIESID